MHLSLIPRNTLIWLGLFGLGFLNGALRELGIKRFVPEPYAHHLSALTALVIFTLYVFGIWNRTRIKNSREAVMIGLLWLVLTILTETFVLNRWISHLSWEQIFDTYNIARGELWPLVLLGIACLPWVALSHKGPSSD
ncbi:MAG TPA: hypothetical protein VE954_20600 [Oligoflexus sp.]|uniref:hypothetical protein n=1 Tax=Oligoflexus sp. TaxID=1971216 RepID=UPI002D354EBB|nr:hypothetical protein [Oligoflexus sp.]HYX35503.1 hypothetical protein [Oligoflexus sp.]